jgi:hypothetical protein
MKSTRKYIILLSGEKRAGKDTVSQMMIEYLHASGKKVVKTAFAAKLKEAASALVRIIYDTDCFTVDQFSDESIRQNEYPFGQMNWGGKQICLRTVLQHFGTEVCREHIDNDIWVNTVIKFIKQNNDNNDVIIVTDARFPNEISRIHEKFKNRYIIMSILVKRPGLNHNDGHASEAFFAGMEKDGMYTHVINNNANLATLQERVCELLSKKITSDLVEINGTNTFGSVITSRDIQTWWGC